MAERQKAHFFHLLILPFLLAAAMANNKYDINWRYQRVRLRSERLLASVSAGKAPSPVPLRESSASPARVYHVTDYGADPTGSVDSTAAILRAVSDAFQQVSNSSLIAGVVDLGGVEIDLDGGSYLISSPINFPSTPAGNLKFHSGSLHASTTFPKDRYLIELWSSAPSIPSTTTTYSYEYITFSSLLLDANYLAGGIAVVNSLRTLITSSYIIHFSSDAIWVHNGHETLISTCFLGQHVTAGSDPGERSFSGTAIRLAGNDNYVTDVVIFSAAVGILVSGGANSISGVHCYNKAAGFGGTGIYLKLPGQTLTRIENCYMDYTGIVSEDPVQLQVLGSFFLGDANVVLKSVNGVMRGVDIVGNTFSGGGKGVEIVRLDETAGAFTAVDQVVVEKNSVDGMSVRSTAARTAVNGNGTTVWTADFSPVLLFANRIDHVQYTLMAGSGFVNHVLRNVTGNRVVIETDVAVTGTAYVAVGQCQGSMS